jgi:hypothetical protein
MISTDSTIAGPPMPAAPVCASQRRGDVPLAPAAVRRWLTDAGTARRTRSSDVVGDAACPAGYAEHDPSSTPGAQPRRDH